jgi:hypothetical protein
MRSKTPVHPEDPEWVKENSSPGSSATRPSGVKDPKDKIILSQREPALDGIHAEGVSDISRAVERPPGVIPPEKVTVK